MGVQLKRSHVGNTFFTQDGRTGKLIAYDPKLKRPWVFNVDGQVWTRLRNGTHCRTCDGRVYPAIVENLGVKNNG